MDLFSRIVPNLPWFSGTLILLAIIDCIRTLQIIRSGVRTVGTVIEIDQSNEGDTPIIAYTAGDGRRYRFRVGTVVGKELWELGGKWPVVYHPDRPQHALVDRFPQLWGSSIIFASLGVIVFIGLSVIVFFFPAI